MAGTIVWWYVTGAGFVTGILFLLVSSAVGFLILNQLIPLLSDVKRSVQDLGDITAHTMGSVSDTLELAELRITQATEQAAHAGISTSHRSGGIGIALAVLMMTSKLIGSIHKPKKKRRKR